MTRVPSDGADARPTSLTLRQHGFMNNGLVIAGACFITSAVILVLALTQSETLTARLDAVTAAVLILVLGYWLGAYPRLIVTATHLVVINPIHTCRIPIDRIIDIRDRGSVTFFVESGSSHQSAPRQITSWAAPSAARPGIVTTALRRGSRMRSATETAPPWIVALESASPVREAMRSVRRVDVAHESNSEFSSVEQTWNFPVLALVFITLVANVSIWSHS